MSWATSWTHFCGRWATSRGPRLGPHLLGPSERLLRSVVERLWRSSSARLGRARLGPRLRALGPCLLDRFSWTMSCGPCLGPRLGPLGAMLSPCSRSLDHVSWTTSWTAFATTSCRFDHGGSFAKRFLCEPMVGVGPFLPGGRAAVGVVMVHDDSDRVARAWVLRCPTCRDACRRFDALSPGDLGRCGRRESLDAPPLARVVVGFAWRRARPLWAASGRGGVDGRLDSGAVSAVFCHFAPVRLSKVRRARRACGCADEWPIAFQRRQPCCSRSWERGRRGWLRAPHGGGAVGRVGHLGLGLCCSIYCGCR